MKIALTPEQWQVVSDLLEQLKKNYIQIGVMQERARVMEAQAEESAKEVVRWSPSSSN